MSLRNAIVLIVAAIGLSGCLTLSGHYTVTAVDAQGKPLLNNMKMTAQGSGIYTSRNAICARYPKAVITIRETETGKNLDGESPYQCR